MKLKSLWPVGAPRLVRPSSFSLRSMRWRLFDWLAANEPIRPIRVEDLKELEVWIFMEKGSQQIDFKVFTLRLDEYPRLKDADHLWLGMGLREGMDMGPNRTAYFHLGPDNRYCRDSRTSACQTSTRSYPDPGGRSRCETDQPLARRTHSSLSNIWGWIHSYFFLSNVRALAPASEGKEIES